MDWSNYFYYDNGLLRWNIGKGNKIKGSIAGTIANSGYIRVGIDNKYYSVHRVIWEMLIGEIPNGLELDHIDRVKSNNKLENLRLLNNSLNQLNKDTPTFSKRSNGKFRVRITLGGKRLHLGDFSTYDDALLVYNKEKEKALEGAIYGKNFIQEPTML